MAMLLEARSTMLACSCRGTKYLALKAHSNVGMGSQQAMLCLAPAAWVSHFCCTVFWRSALAVLHMVLAALYFAGLMHADRS